MRVFLCISILFLLVFETNAQQKNLNLIVGTYTKNCEQKGIFVYQFDTKSGDFLIKSNTLGVVNPGYLAVSDDKKFVYATNQDGKDSFVSAFSFDSKTGNLSFLNKLASAGNDPCFVLNDEKNVFLANYNGGTISVFKKDFDGSLLSNTQVVKHFGSSINLKRQDKPHVHQVQFSRDKKFILACDLGTDKIMAYSYFATKNENILVKHDSTLVKPSSGPRHLTFSPNGKYVYVLHEMGGFISCYGYKNGKLSFLNEFPLHTDIIKGDSSAADIHITPDGLFLYASNRGAANEIYCYKINKEGLLDFQSVTKSNGKSPRNFVIDPTGKFLLVANQNSNTVVVFSINKKTGALTATGKSIEVCAPVCLVFSKI